MSTQSPLHERFVVGVDGEGYSPRSTRHQQLFQENLVEILDDTADRAGVERPSWRRVPGGDGELAVLPPDVDLAAVVGPFVRSLNIRLAEHNDDSSPGTQIRLRVAMHTDVLVESAYEFAGPALNDLSRILNSDQARDALLASQSVDGASLALIVSEPVYRKVVLAGFGGLRPLQFREVTVSNKNFRASAYVHVPGCDMRKLDLGGGQGETDDSSSDRPDPPGSPRGGGSAGHGPRQSTTTLVNGNVESDGGSISIGNIRGGHPQQG